MRPAIFLAFAFLAAPPLACGGATAALDASADGGPDGSPVGPPVEPPADPTSIPDRHRPSAAACPAHASNGVPCLDDTQCQQITPGAAVSYCLGGTCGPDTCLSDADCAGGQVCACLAAAAPGNGGYPGSGYVPGNACVVADCRVDADCGPGGYCSPTVDPNCGNLSGVVGYYCHRPGDACQRNADCDVSGQAAPPSCAYDATVSRWICGRSACAG